MYGFSWVPVPLKCSNKSLAIFLIILKMNYFCSSADWGVAVQWVSLTSRHGLIRRRHVQLRKRGWWWKRGGGFAHRAVVLNSVPTGPDWCLWSRAAVGVKTPTIRRESNTLHTTSFWVWLLLKTTLNTCGSETRSGRCLLLNGRIVQSLAQAYILVYYLQVLGVSVLLANTI